MTPTSPPWTDGPIDGVVLRPLTAYRDERGWLAEIFRHDELPEAHYPTMAYVSLTHAGVARGPHEHRDQTDLFAFYSGRFRLYLWDARADAPTHGRRQVVDVGAANPTVAVIPPGVVHAYRNVGDADALVVNCPNRLYAGWNKAEEVDEIRHEDAADSAYRMD